MDNVWRIRLLNYMGQDDTVYFANYESAKKNFDYLRDMYSDMPEFKINRDEDKMSWHNTYYNEYSTYVYLFQGGPKLYNEIVF